VRRDSPLRRFEAFDGSYRLRPIVPQFPAETAATSQSMFSFLAQEIRERKNLGILCHSLPLAARRLGFDWAFEGVELHRVFQARVFDNRRTLPDDRWYESASRFNSQIPLEYAYGAWGKLPVLDAGGDRRLLEPFRVTLDQVGLFARARLRALQHIESTFKVRNRFAPKEPLNLPKPAETAGPKNADLQVGPDFWHPTGIAAGGKPTLHRSAGSAVRTTGDRAVRRSSRALAPELSSATSYPSPLAGTCGLPWPVRLVQKSLKAHARQSEGQSPETPRRRGP